MQRSKTWYLDGGVCFLVLTVYIVQIKEILPDYGLSKKRLIVQVKV